MAQKNYAEEYLIAIIPELDRNKFNKEKKKVDKELKALVKEQNKEDKQRKSADRERNQSLRQAVNLISALGKGAGTFASSFSKALPTIGVVVTAFTVMLEMMLKITKSATEFSNKMITASSAFVDKDTRNLMAQFGVSGQTATGLGSVMGLMGISSSDLQYMTPGQMQLFSRLMDQWTEGMNSIDPNKMESFNTLMQEVQSEIASAKLELQIEFYRMLVDLGPEISDFFRSITNVIRSFANLLNSPIVKTALKVLFSIAETIINVLSDIVNFVSGNWDEIGNYSNSGSTTNNSYITITSTSTNTFNGDTNSMYSLATATQESDSNYISTTLLNTGKV